MGTFSFLLGVAFAYEISFVGRVPAAEILALASVPLLVNRMRSALAASRWLKRLLAMGVLWWGSQLATDLYRQTPWQDMVRGQGRIIMLLLVLWIFTALVLAAENPAPVVIKLMLGIIVGEFLEAMLWAPPLAESAPWKFAWGLPVTLTVLMCVGAFSRTRWTSGLPIAALGVLHILMGHRAASGLVMLTGIYWVISVLPPGSGGGVRSRGGVALVAMPIASVVVLGLYGAAASAGLLGAEASEKYAVQSDGDLGVLIGGRSEVFGSVAAISLSPLVGYGSWSSTAQPQFDLARREVLNALGYEDVLLVQDKERVGAHSLALGSWVEGGFLGFIFWCAVGVFIVGGLRRSMKFATGAVGLPAVYLSLQALWDIAFSPFGTSTRRTIPLVIAMLLLAAYVRYPPRFDKSEAKSSSTHGEEAAGTAGRV